jgi:hypothetical protein
MAILRRFSSFSSRNSKDNRNSPHSSASSVEAVANQYTQYQPPTQQTLDQPRMQRKSLSFSRRRRSSLLSNGGTGSKRDSIASLSADGPNYVTVDSTNLPNVDRAAISRSNSNKRLSMPAYIPDASKPDFSKDTPPEMIPVLTLLTAHKTRDYKEGYFMILHDLGNGMLLCSLLL